jgi:SAM-dependent methyltransferase
MNRIRNFYLREIFTPSLPGIFINPMFFIRRGLKRGIVRNRKFLSGRMLDFGCGTKPYQRFIDVREYIGLEIKSDELHDSGSAADVFYDGNTIPFGDDQFDSVFSSEVFEHVFNLEQILQELHRVLKPGGNMVITLPFVWEEHSVPYDFARYTSFGITWLLEKNGFEIISSEKTTNYVETIFQLWNSYIYQNIFPGNKYIKAVLTPFFIAPVTIIGILFSMILPAGKGFYHNNVIVCKNLEKTFTGLKNH